MPTPLCETLSAVDSMFRDTRLLRAAVTACLMIAFTTVTTPARAQQPSGAAVYAKHCAACHEQTSPRIPPRAALQKMPAARILRTLDGGAMMTVAFTMSHDEREAVASYLGTADAVTGPPQSAFCRDRNVRLGSTPSLAWNGWSPGTGNARFQSADAAKLTADQIPRLKLKWAFGFEGDVSAFAQPTVIDGHLFVGSAGGVVHAMRADTGCLEWTFQANGPVRAAIVAAAQNNRRLLFFGDMTGWFYALDAANGKLAWKVRVEDHDSTRLTAAAAVHDGVVFVPVSSWEETRASDADYPCCTFRGSVVALRIGDGQRVWKTYLVDPPKEIGKTTRGVAAFGPSGAGVWSTPTLDVKRGVLYVTTGDNYSAPGSATSDAVVALELKTGAVRWSKQMTAGDVFSGACASRGPACPEGGGPDYDFGSSSILTTRADGREVLLAGQKSGIVYALDPDKRGDIIWQTRVAKGGTTGGIQWGMSTDGQRVYAAISDMARTLQNSALDPRRFVVDRNTGGGLTALRLADGRSMWSAPAIPCAAEAPLGCSPAQTAAVTSIPGVVFSPSNDGHLRAYSATDGTVLWDYDTMREVSTVNGLKAHGGSIDGPGAVVANGMVFVNSGYSRNGGVPGNVLLAFAP